MTEESYNSDLYSIDAEIAETEANLRRLKGELSEAESALESSRKMRSDFDRFIERRKSSIVGYDPFSIVNSFSSFLKKANNLLNGSSYAAARDGLDDADRLIKEKIRQINGDIEFCRQELRRLNDQKASLKAEYINYLNSLPEAEE